MKSPNLENPNGLLIKGDNLLVAAWGKFSNKKPLTAKKGNLLSVSLTDKKITKLSSHTLGQLDGIQEFPGNNLLLSDWVSGKLYYVDERFHAEKMMDLEQSAGDICYLSDKEILLVPMAKQSKVLAFKLKKP